MAAALGWQLLFPQEPAEVADGLAARAARDRLARRNWSWIAFFAVMGVLNLWVAYNFDTDTWVNFKLFGGLGLMACSWWARRSTWRY